MSRRKQKFPSHISGEDESDHCQDLLHHEQFPSSVDSETCTQTEPQNEESKEMDFVIETPSDAQILPMESTESLDEVSHRQQTTNVEDSFTSSSDDAVLHDETEKESSDRLLIIEEPISCSSPNPSEGAVSVVNYPTYDSQTISANSNTSAKNEAYKLKGGASSAMFSDTDGTSDTRVICKHLNGYRAEKKVEPSEKIKANAFKCPVCSENFKSKRSFNSHILVHCQLVNNRASIKRSLEEASCSSLEKRKNQTEISIKSEFNDLHFPLDLSCKRNGSSVSPCSFFKSERLKASSSSPELDICLNSSLLSDRSPLDDEHDNLANEAREHEKAFFDHSQNELFLTEDSTILEPPQSLPMFHSGGVTRKIRVSSDEGSPMVYRIKTHAEQIFISRILGTNEETGDKIELYKCYMCNISFPSVTKLQLHLGQHKQRFVCSKCNYSCDSRADFSHHVQKKHITHCNGNRYMGRSSSDSGDDSTSAENTVTVAALLSALHGGSVDRQKLSHRTEDGRSVAKAEDESRQEDLFPSSPSYEPHVEDISGGASGDMFKLFSCRFCGKKFDRAFSCNRHERVHTGFKPCFCRICGRGFSEPRNLRHHVIRFHSDGSLRHLIKRDRRKRKGEESPPQISDSVLIHTDVGDISFSQNCHAQIADAATDRLLSNGLRLQQNAANPYTNTLTKMFAATLDQSNLLKRVDNTHPSTSDSMVPNGGPGGLMSQVSMFRMSDDSLEPGEIRLNLKTRIIDDGERGRRMVVTEDQSEEDSDHSPQFSSYAPRLNIVQEPVQRTKALVPITDDIGRTFYECPYCPKLFGSTSDLNRHLDFHEDLRPYECGYCDYSARTNSQLKVHKMRHEGIKQFTCEICNYNGVTQSDLNRHKKTQSHIARSQNVCRVCGLGFYSNSQKQVHIVKCHPEMEGASSLIQMSLGIPSASFSCEETGENLALPSSSSSDDASSPLNLVYTTACSSANYISTGATPAIVSSN